MMYNRVEFHHNLSSSFIVKRVQKDTQTNIKQKLFALSALLDICISYIDNKTHTNYIFLNHLYKYYIQI